MELWRRLDADFLMPSRLGEYARLLDTLLEHRYEVVSIAEFWARHGAGSTEPHRRYVLLRHDVDTGLETARRMLETERAHGVRCTSYYFRLGTLDTGLMREIAAGGGEAGYHYEELATLVKQRRPASRAAALECIPDAQEAFRRNIERIRAQTGLPIRIVASHGDFANRAVGVPNWKILEDAEFRASAGVDLEVYDDALVRHVTSRHSDTAPPRCWIPADPVPGTADSPEVMYLLVHPRHWHVDRRANAVDDVRRVWEGVRYRWGV